MEVYISSIAIIVAHCHLAICYLKLQEVNMTEPNRPALCLPYKRKVVIGGLGALTPIIISLLVVDLGVVFKGVTTVVFLTYTIRVLVLFYLGALVACLHKDENDQLKLFELGIAAPALLTVLINGAQLSKDTRNAATPPQEIKSSAGHARLSPSPWQTLD